MTEVGTFIKYAKREPGARSMELILMSSAIVQEYEGRGYAMTLRQLYYQLVARGLIPNRPESYDRLGDAVSDGRMAGMISWTGIEDRTRSLKGLRTWSSPAESFRDARESYLTDRWAGQPYRPEVWIEKEALAGVIEPICADLCVDFFACRGYNSQSEQWRAGRRFASYVRKGQRPIVFHLGDHDPSGIDMTRDNRDRLEMFAGVPVQVVRLALNMDQIERYSPPPNPAKLSDARAKSYVEKYGDESWELDALSPEVLRDLIVKAVTSVRDAKRWDDALAREAAQKDEMDAMIEDMKGEP